MGEAKRRAAASGSVHGQIDARLRQLGIDTAHLGFYDQPPFLAEERRNGEFLEQYALWVQSRPRTAEYDQRVRDVVPRLTGFIADLFESEDMQRSCVHASSMLPRILDRLGVWSFGLHGSLIMQVEREALWRGQSVCDIQRFPGAQLGHAWVVAPPFVVVDPTVRMQNPAEDPMNEFTPPIIAAEVSSLIKPAVDDIVGADMRADYLRIEGRLDSELHHRLVPQLKDFSRRFPSREVRVGEMALRYVPIAVRLSDVGLEEINSEGDRLKGGDVWNHVARTVPEFVMNAP